MTACEVRDMLKMWEKEAASTGEAPYYKPEFLAVLYPFLETPSLDTAISLLEVAPATYSVFEKCSPGGDFYEMNHLLEHDAPVQPDFEPEEESESESKREPTYEQLRARLRELELASPTPTVRSYRFGMALGVLNLLAGTYYGWLAVSSGSMAGAVVLGLSALLGLGTGIGLVRKRRYGLVLLYLGFLMAAVDVITDWFKPHAWGSLYYVLLNLAFFSALLAIVAYFYKRRGEFR